MTKRKKSRRHRTPNLPAQAAAVRQQTRQQKQVNLTEEYAYVGAELRRIALIAGVMLAGLVILSLILR